MLETQIAKIVEGRASPHIVALRRAAGSNSEVVRAHLYECLGFLDSKASSLLGINSVVAAVFAVLLVPTFTLATALAVAAGMGFVAWSSLVLLGVIAVRWSTTEGLEEMVVAERRTHSEGTSLDLAPSGHLEWLLALRDQRTARYDRALQWTEGALLILAAAFLARLVS